MSHLPNKSSNHNNSSDSDDMGRFNLDKDDEDIQFDEEKEIDDDEDMDNKKDKKRDKKKDKKEKINAKNSKLGPLFPPYYGQCKNSFPIIRKHGRKISFKSSSSSSSDEYNMKIKKDLEANFNKKLTNFQIAQAKSQKDIFLNNFNVLKNDFRIIEEYEKLIFKDTELDIMFIMDLTGSMGIWLNEAKHNIKKITEEISDNFPGTKIRLSFIGYRDFDNKGDRRDYEIINFTENIENFISSVKKFECYGGGDQPEDIAGALNEALKMDWKSNARYVVLVCDAPCHGTKYHDIYLDNFSEGDPDGLTIEDLMNKFKNLNITFYCLEINDSTKKMFKIMKDVYNNNNKFGIEKIGNTAEKLSFFVAFSASELLGTTKYDNISFIQVLDKCRKDSIDKIMKKYQKNNKEVNKRDKDKDESLTQSLINEINNINLEGEDKLLFDFVSRMNNLDINNIETEENDQDNYINFDFDLNYFLINQGIDINYKINGYTYNKNNISGINSFTDPVIIEQNFDTNITLNFGFEEKKNSLNYNHINFYDNKISEDFQGKIPKRLKKEYYNNIKLLIKNYCLNDLICEQIADYFNIEIKPETNQYIKFRKNVIYEKEDQTTDDKNKIIICDFARIFPDILTEEPSKKILQAFSHFSYQITFGELIITDLKYSNKRIKEYNIYFLKENGYKKILEFFAGHICNDICKYLDLINLRKNSNNKFSEQFYSKRFCLDYNICKGCSIPIRKNSVDNYCCKCICQKIKSMKKMQCENCRGIFDYSSFEYNSSLINYPKKCKKCSQFF